MDNMELECKAIEEAGRLYEKEFSYNNPYTVIIEDDGIPFTQREEFYSMVEKELLNKGEKIKRYGQFFKIERYQKR